MQITKYGDRVPVQIGMQVIEQLVSSTTEKELQGAGETWRQVHLSTNSLEKEAPSGIASVPEYDFGGKKGKVHVMKEVIIPPLMTTVVKDMTWI